MASVIRERTGEVEIVRLNRPDALNAMNVDLLTELIRALADVGGAKVVVLEGEGRAFCVGEDLKQTLAPRTHGADELRHSFGLLQDITRLMSSSSAVFVAAVQGYAVGGGAELALAADLVIVQAGTRLRFPEVTLGHAVTGGITARLPALVGLMRAKELLLSGRWIDADEAARIGLAIELADDARERARAIAGEFAQLPGRSLGATKRGLELAALPNQTAVLAAEIDAALHCFAATEAAESIGAFQASHK
jgi:enoyl-CoA hydratase/carnithine racemase